MGRFDMPRWPDVFALVLNLYTMHFLLLPYYTGLVAHAANGAFRSAHIGILSDEIRLSQVLRSPFVRTGIISPVIYTASWTTYALGALIPILLALRISYFSGKARHN
ncbi:MAG TPA: hypothetical protein VHZ07_02375 [Bryobacteraceae bacterium]|jgi:hypothetical protein|nr:hypothetical protein [Bryobacteraceae bacterium]